MMQLHRVKYLIPVCLCLVAGNSWGGWTLGAKPNTPVPVRLQPVPQTEPLPAARPAEAGTAVTLNGQAFRVGQAAADPEPTPGPVSPPQVTLPATYKSAMGLVILKAECNYPEMYSGLVWESPDDLEFHSDAIELKPGYILATAQTPGEKRLRAIGAIGNKPALSDWCVITVQGAQPPPQPEPKPDPKPDPQPQPGPTAAKLWIVTITDSVTPREISAVLGDVATWQGFKAAGHQYIQLDSRDPQAAPYLPWMAKAGGSTVCLLDAVTKKCLNCNQPADLKIPTTAAGLKTLINKYSGAQ